VIPVIPRVTALEAARMGRRDEQAILFYQFRLDERVPKDHLLRHIDRFVTPALADVHERLQPYYSEIGRPSVDPELMIRMLLVGYCYGLRSERRLTQDVDCIWRIAGSVDSISTTKFLTIRRSLRTV
jgi:transposase